MNMTHFIIKGVEDDKELSNFLVCKSTTNREENEDTFLLPGAGKSLPQGIPFTA